MTRDIFADVAAILHPMPEPPTDPTPDDEQGYDEWRREVAEQQQRVIEGLRQRWEANNEDPLLTALTDEVMARDEAAGNIRRLLAYGREFVAPRPYTLTDLGAATGMSVSGVRTAYDHHEVEQVAEYTGAKPREWRAPELSEVEALLAAMAAEHPVPARPGQVAAILQLQGWTPAAPEGRGAGPNASKQYVSWRRTWPNGVTVTLYQHATYVATSNKVTVDAHRFSFDYAQDDPKDLDRMLEVFAAAIGGTPA